MVTVDEKPMAAAWWVADEISDDDPLRHIKQRAADHLAAAEVLGQVARKAAVGARADRIDQAAALFADPAFDLEETYGAAEAAMPGADVNAASYIGLILRE